jgi:hypothetical protein
MKVVLDDGSLVTAAELQAIAHRSRHVRLYRHSSRDEATFTPNSAAGDTVEQALEDRARLLRLTMALLQANSKHTAGVLKGLQPC